jgi:hypothetical protein
MKLLSDVSLRYVLKEQGGTGWLIVFVNFVMWSRCETGTPTTRPSTLVENIARRAEHAY